MSMRLQRADWLLAAVLAVLGAIAVLLTATAEPEKVRSLRDDFPSTFYNDEDGAKALFLVAGRLDYDVDRLRRVITTSTIEGFEAIVLLRPTVELTRDERSVLIAWVRDGGRLLVAPSDHLDAWFQFHHADVEADDEPLAAEPATTIVPAAALSSLDAIFTGVRQLQTYRAVRLKTGAPLAEALTDAGAIAQPIWTDEDGVAMLRVGIGRGTMLVMGDTYPLSNVGLRQADNAVLMSNLLQFLAGPGGGAIAFDEYHLGHEQRDGSVIAIGRLLLEGERGWGVGLLALIAVGVRFGKPVGVIRRRRRRHSEFVNAAARLLDDANAIGPVAGTLVEHYRQRMITMLRLGPDVDDDALAAAVRQQVASDVKSALMLRQRTTNVTRQNLLDAVGRLHRAMEALEHGTLARHR